MLHVIEFGYLSTASDSCQPCGKEKNVSRARAGCEGGSEQGQEEEEET